MTADESRMLFELHLELVVRPMIAAAQRGEGPLIQYLPPGCKRLAGDGELQALREAGQIREQPDLLPAPRVP